MNDFGINMNDRKGPSFMPAKRKDTSQIPDDHAARVTVQLTGAQLAALDRMGVRERTTLSSLIRRAIDRLLDGEKVDEAAFGREVAFRQWLVTKTLPLGAPMELAQEFEKRAARLEPAKRYAAEPAPASAGQRDAARHLMGELIRAQKRFLDEQTRLLEALNDKKTRQPVEDPDATAERAIGVLRRRLHAGKKEGVLHAMNRKAKKSSEPEVEELVKESISAAMHAELPS